MQRYAVIVDPVSTGQEYADAFREAGIEPVAVLSSGSTPPPAFVATWYPEKFPHTHAFNGDVRALAEIVAGYEPICIIPGAETGVELADALLDIVAPGTGNVPELVLARRDKWHMALAVEGAGLPHLRQLATDDPDEIAKWLADTGLHSARVVVKPPKSMGTDNVHFVPAGGDWRPAFDEIYGRVNRAGIRNDAVLVEEFAEGPEFLIDSYSVDGEHGLVDVCRYTKAGRDDRIGIYEVVEFLAPDHPDVLAVWPYTRKVLDALGVRNGCGHSEVILTPGGPRLLEVAARPAGGGHQGISKLATGDNHILRTVAHRVRGEFHRSYELRQFVRGVFISAAHAGIWRNAEIFDEVESFPTYASKNFPHATGDLVAATVDLFTPLAWFILASPDESAVEADHRRIKELERRILIDPVA